MVCGLGGDSGLGRNVDLRDFQSGVDAALAAVRLIGELGAAQLHHTEQVGDIALVFDVQVEMLRLTIQLNVNPRLDSGVAGGGDFRNLGVEDNRSCVVLQSQYSSSSARLYG